MLAFSYEWGYADYFGIPRRLIALDLVTVILAIGGVTVFAFILWSLTLFGRGLSRRLSARKEQQTQEQQRQQVRYRKDQWEQVLDEDLERAFRALGRTSVLVAVFFLLGVSLAAGAGYLKASEEVQFLITNTSPEMAVLRLYEDRLVCATFDRTTGILGQGFVVLNIPGDRQGLEMHFEIIHLEPDRRQLGRVLNPPSPSELMQEQ
jgi:hypothetical protein